MSQITKPPVTIFTDGSCIMRRGKPQQAGWAWASWISFDPKKETTPNVTRVGGRFGATNNQMEAIALADALEYYVDYPGDIFIHADSELAIKWSLQIYKHKRTATETPEDYDIRRKAITSAISSLAKRKNTRHKTVISHTRAHTGYWPNEFVDKTAKDAGKNTFPSSSHNET